MSTRLVYSEGRHTYSLDGERVPSVTTVIGKATGKPGLIKWSARLAAEWCADHHADMELLGSAEWTATATRASDRARDLAAAEGTALHKMAEALLYGDALPMTLPNGDPVPDHVRRSAEQIARFLDTWQVDPVVHEAAVFHEDHRWAGRLDLVADLSDGARWLIDWKTGASGVWPEASLQLAAYAAATHVQVGDRDMLMTPISRAGCVWVRPDGWELIPVRIGPEVYDVFRHAMAVAAWVSQRREDSVAAPLPVPA
jgi:hypothetical protein